MVWIDEWLTAKLVTVLISASLACLVSVGRVFAAHTGRAHWPGFWRFLRGLVGAGLLALGAGAIASGMMVESLPKMPYFVATAGAALGVSADLSTSAGPIRLLQLGLALLARMAESARLSLGSREEKRRDDSTPDE